MDENSTTVQTLSRKRKIVSLPSLSDPLTGPLTRSKSQIYVHRSRSGRCRSGPLPRNTLLLRPKPQPEEAFEVNCNAAARISSIKDLRARRIFTPHVDSILAGKKEGYLNEGKELLKSLDMGSDAGQVVDANVGEVKLDKTQRFDEIRLKKEEDKQNDKNNASNLENQVVCGNGSISQTKMVVNSCSRRKVFKTPSSFSYRRLLPYLMDIAQHDCSVPKIELVDAGAPSQLQKSHALNSEVPSIGDNSYTATVEHTLSHPCRTKLSENEVIQNFETEPPCNHQGSSVEDELNQNCLHTVDSSFEEDCGQMTPPDPDILAKMDVSHNGGTRDANNVPANHRICTDLSVCSERSFHNLSGQSPDGKHSTNIINRSVLKPCSQLKVFKNPRSLSYRRLLPFLMDISKYNSCESRLSQCPNPVVDLTEDLHPPTPYNAEANHIKEMGKWKLYEIEKAEDQGQDSLSSTTFLREYGLSSHPDSNHGSSMPVKSSTTYSSNAKPNPITSENDTDQHELIGLQKKGMKLSECSSTKVEAELYLKDVKNILHEENSSALQPSYTANDVLSKPATSEEPGSVDRQKFLDVAEIHNISGELVEKDALNQSSFHIQVPDAFITPSNGPSKGILKRNPIGCRGPCNCLNCVSFRLHAIRAFEFSRNQMHGAEEVVSELMRELASLRVMLQESIVGDDALAFLQLNPVQVKQACSKALEAENLAKERLSQLNYDLNVHCRIPALLQPKVTFANHIQERAIPMLDPSIAGAEKKG